MSEPHLALVRADGVADMAVVRTLFLEYQAWLGVDLCFQGFEQELAGLPGGYVPPGGGLWLARDADEVAGVVGLRAIQPGVAEMKRLWVRPAYRGHGLGRRLAQTAVSAARAAGYRSLCLDTLGHMTAAHRLYRSLGFQEIPAYYDNPLEDVRYLELDLTKLSHTASPG